MDLPQHTAISTNAHFFGLIQRLAERQFMHQIEAQLALTST